MKKLVLALLLCLGSLAEAQPVPVTWRPPTTCSTNDALKWSGTAWVCSGGATVTGTGTTNSVTKWTGTGTVGNSIITDNGTDLKITSGGGAIRLNMQEDSNRYIGIGNVSTPIATLDVYESNAGQTTAALTDAGDRSGLVFVQNGATSAGAGGGIVFGNSQSHTANAVGFAALKGLLTSGAGNTTGDLAFSTRNATGDTALTERMRIAGGGTVGIATATPKGLLSVASTNTGDPNGSLTAWDAKYSTFGPNVGSTTGAALGLGYDTTNDVATIAAAVPSTGFKPVRISSNGVTFNALNGVLSQKFDSSGGVWFGDTANSAVNNNVDVLTVGNTGTGQTSDSKALIALSRTGSFDTTAGVINTYGVLSSVSSTRSAGANSLVNRAGYFNASGAQVNQALITDGGDVYLNASSGTTGIGTAPVSTAKLSILGSGNLDIVSLSQTGTGITTDGTALVKSSNTGTFTGNSVTATVNYDHKLSGNTSCSDCTVANLKLHDSVELFVDSTGDVTGDNAIYPIAIQTSSGDNYFGTNGGYPSYFNGNVYVDPGHKVNAELIQPTASGGFTVGGATHNLGTWTASTGNLKIRSGGSGSGALYLHDNTSEPVRIADSNGSVVVQNWISIIKTADQDVTNSATLADDSALQFSVTAGKIYAIDAFIIAGGSDTTGDYKSGWAVAAGTMDCSGEVNSLTTADAIQDTTVIATAAAATNATSIGTRADATLPIATRWTLACKVSNTTTLKYQFAENSAVSAKVARTMAGSVVKYRQLN